MVKSRSLRVPKGEAERARSSLAVAGALRTDLRPDREGDFVHLPVKDVETGVQGELGEHDFTPGRKTPPGYRDIAHVPPEIRKQLPRAFDVIGRVIVIKIPQELGRYRFEIGKALLLARPEARSVARDRGVQGEDRVRSLEVVAGDPDLETIHTEHGLKFALDPSKVYFSPRLATERQRVAGLVAEKEVVLDMFAGVGPFSIHIARRARPSRVYASDINPVAIEYLKRNIRLNRASGVEPMFMDARLLPGKIPVVDRIVMNLPHSAPDFLPQALKMLRPGGTVHLYEILESGEKAARKEALARMVEEQGRRLGRISLRLVRGYSAFESHYVADLTVE